MTVSNIVSSPIAFTINSILKSKKAYVSMLHQFTTEQNVATIACCDNPAVFVLKAANLPLATRCVTHGLSARPKTHENALGGSSYNAISKRDKQIPHFPKKGAQFLLFFLMLYVSDGWKSERCDGRCRFTQRNSGLRLLPL